MIPTLVLAFLASSQWQAPAGDPAANPWPFYGDPLVGPREVVCLRPEWLYIGMYKGAPVRGWYPGTCWSRRIYRRYVY